jgi:hypothetical protein
MNRSRTRAQGAPIFIMLIALAACSAASSPSPAPSTADDAARLALAQDARFAGIGPHNPDLIGQSAWYEVAASNAGWQVQIYLGWGDCPAGCINHHTWVYQVTRDGAVELLSEEGDPLAGETGLRGTVVAGPTCPVVSDPPDPDCADRPVAGAVLVILDGTGEEVARVTSAEDGSFAIGLAPGSYRVVPQPVDGLMGIAAEVEVRVEVGEPTGDLVVAYDTGIR